MEMNTLEQELYQKLQEYKEAVAKWEEEVAHAVKVCERAEQQLKDLATNGYYTENYIG
jgi:ribosome-binding ATPase YchF (GTP1/OBG family)